MADSCCLQGFEWSGTPIGKETKFNDQTTYVTGSNKDAAILVVADLFGWTFNNIRLLADHYAKEANATVYVPDFFGGEVIDPKILVEERWQEIDLKGFQKRNDKDVRWPEIESFAKALRDEYGRLGTIGYCYGGWTGLWLGSAKYQLVDCVSIAHPTWATKEELDDIAVPIQIVAPEIDAAFTPELKAHANTVIPTKGVPYDYQFFPGVVHAMATRGDPNAKNERRSMIRAKNAAVAWMKEWLHEDDVTL